MTIKPHDLNMETSAESQISQISPACRGVVASRHTSASYTSMLLMWVFYKSDPFLNLCHHSDANSLAFVTQHESSQLWKVCKFFNADGEVDFHPDDHE